MDKRCEIFETNCINYVA